MDAQFQGITSDFIADFSRFSPINATSAGDHRYDDLVDEISQESRDQERDFYREMEGLLSALDRDRLSRANQVDYQLLLHYVQQQQWQLNELQEWAWNPLKYTSLAGGAIYNLMARDFGPLQERLLHATARLNQFPRFLEQVRETLDPKRVPKEHAETALKQNRGVLSVLKNLVEPHLAKLPQEKQRQLFDAIALATTAVNEHQKWLESDLLPNALGNFRLGKELYDQKLSWTLQTNFSRQRIHDLASAELKRVRAEMYDISRTFLLAQNPSGNLPLSPSAQQQQATIQQCLEMAYLEMPARDQIVATAEASMKLTVDFIRDHNLVTVPSDPLEIILMPEFQRGVSFAYCDSPGPLDVGQKTFYAVAPLPESWTDEQCKSFLREYNLRSIHNLTIHEAMPGHFLQIAHANRYPSQLRAVLASGVFIEGWACYTEQMMSEEGFLDFDPLMRLITLKWYLRSLVNSLIDQAIHVDGLQREAAMRMMTEDAFQEEREAAAKWIRAQLTSTQLSTYFVGYQEHRAMRGAAEKHWKTDFQLKTYHDRAISFGAPPVRYAQALLLEQPIPD